MEDIGYTVDYGAADEYSSADLGRSCVCEGNGSRRTTATNESDKDGQAGTDGERRRLSDKGRAEAERIGRRMLRDRVAELQIDGVEVLRSAAVLYEEDSHIHGVYVSLDDSIDGDDE